MTTEPQQAFTVNPDVIGAIIAIATVQHEKTQQNTLAHWLLLSTKKYLTHPQVALKGDITPAAWAYYLTAYMQYYSVAAQALGIEPDQKTLQSEAILALFDIYLADPTILINRRILCLAAAAAHEIICEEFETLPSEKTTQAIVSGGNLALITATINVYVRQKYRTENLTYIAWVKRQLERWFDDAHGMVDTFPSVSDPIIATIRKQQRVITLPH